jgi:uncharacterized protein
VTDQEGVSLLRWLRRQLRQPTPQRERLEAAVANDDPGEARRLLRTIPFSAAQRSHVESLLSRWEEGRGGALRGLFAEDAVWTVPGNGAMAGVYQGREEIFRFLARLPKETDGTYSSELVDVLASETRAAALYRARGTRHRRTLELDQLLLFRIGDGLVQEVLALPSDPEAFETFWA